MTSEYGILLTTAITLGVLHTAIGVDHTLPFVVLGRARKWSLRRTLGVTAICGLGHVLSSMAVGGLGWAIGATAGRLEFIESSRGSIAAWLMVAFGTVYAIFGWLRMRDHQHRHVHVHSDGTVHAHGHAHDTVQGRVLHRHAHVAGRALPFETSKLLPALFIIFVMGPCEALIPLMFAPALGGQLWMAWSLALAFSLATLVTMVSLVALGFWGLKGRHLAPLERHLQWGAGVAIALSGLGIQVLGI